MSEATIHVEPKVPAYYLVQRHLILGPPNTVRPFRRGEAVEESDFCRCPQMFPRLLRRGSLRLAYPHEVSAALETRERNTHLDMGLSPDASPIEIRQALAERDPSLPPLTPPAPVSEPAPPPAPVEAPRAVVTSVPPAPPAEEPQSVPPPVMGQRETEQDSGKRGPGRPPGSGGR